MRLTEGQLRLARQRADTLSSSNRIRSAVLALSLFFGFPTLVAATAAVGSFRSTPDLTAGQAVRMQHAAPQGGDSKVQGVEINDRLASPGDLQHTSPLNRVERIRTNATFDAIQNHLDVDYRPMERRDRIDGWRITVAVASGDDALQSYRWESRPLLVFAPSEDHADYVKLVRSLRAQRTELLDRDMVVFHLLSKGQSRIEKESLKAQVATALRARFDVRPGEAVMILVGKDGGTKARRPLDDDLSPIFALIDAMPMRLREMQERG